MADGGLPVPFLGGDSSPVEENVLDRVIGWFSPSARLRRIRTRALGNLMAGGYHGGSSGRRSMKDFQPGVGSADADTLDDLPSLRARSRDMVRNTPLATGAVSTNIMSVVGGGIRVSPKINRDVLGLGDEEAQAWERRAQTIFQTWAEDEGADITRTESFYGLQALAFRSTLESGDVLVLRRHDERSDDVLGLKVQLVEADRVSNPNHEPERENLAGGVETDEDGAPVAYHVQNAHPGDTHRVGFFGDGTGRWSRVPAFGEETGERLSFLLYERQRPGQSRGVPYLAPVIEPLKQLDRYSEAELMATVVSSMLTVFIKAESEIYESGSGDAFGLPDQPVGETTGQPDQGDIELGHGMVYDLAPGEDIETVDPTRPNEAFEPFMQAIAQQIGAGLDIPFEVLMKRFQSSFSAARGAIMEAWRAFLNRREWLTRRFCDPVYRWAISEAVSRGMLEAPGFFRDPMIRRAWLGTQWIGPSRGMIRPDREVEAAKKRVEEGFSTRERETAAMTGEDWEKIHRQRRREERLREEAGMSPADEAVSGAE